MKRKKESSQSSDSVPDVSRLMAKGQRHHQNRRFGNAERLYRRVLKIQPDHPDALHFLGVLSHQRGDSGHAVRLIRKVLDIAPENPAAFNNLGRILLEEGDESGAIDAFREAVRLNPNLEDAQMHLGIALRKAGDPEAAIEALSQAAEFARHPAQACYQLGIANKEAGRLEEAAAHYEAALQLDPTLSSVYDSLGFVLYRLNRISDAANVYLRWLKADPGNPKAEHMYRSCSGEGVPGRAADEYVIELFDNFAETFDQSLAGLDYQAPELVARAVDKLVSGGKQFDILDAGCGTGLCGPLLRSHARSLVGVDLSSGMIDKARQRSVYDELIVDEMVACLSRHEAAFDLIASADTLVYFGELEPLFVATAHALRPGGWIVCTLECAADGDGGVRLNPNGRYSHSRQYVTDCLNRAGLSLLEIDMVELRMENKQPVAGMLVVAKR